MSAAAAAAGGGNKRKTLVVFDFDNTLVDDNTDTWIMSIRPELQLEENLTSLIREHENWTILMDHVFHLIRQIGCCKEDVETFMKQLKLFDQAMKAVCAVHECPFAEAIILSDSNTVFIDLILEECGIKHMFGSDIIFSNPAYFEEDGTLRVKKYCSHDCSRCKSMCKGKVLREYLQAHALYNKVVYVGDGRNDYCPVSNLTNTDVVICREGFALSDLLSSSQSTCQARVVPGDFISSLSKLVIDNLNPTE